MTQNTFGTHNNVITVKASDFEAFEALGMDSLETGHYNDNYYIKHGMFNMKDMKVGVQLVVYFMAYVSDCSA